MAEDNKSALVLWDIDGTLISESRFPRLHYQTAMETILKRGPIEPPEWTNGGTDYDILLKMLIREGFSLEEAELLVPPVLWEVEDLTTDHGYIQDDRHVLAGVWEAIYNLKETGCIQSLLTGNSPKRAKAKLEAFSLHAELDLACGGYGDCVSELWRLIDQARDRTQLIYGLKDLKVFVVGSTIHNIAASAKVGASSVAVATGESWLLDLEAFGPDLLLENLMQLDELLKLLPMNKFRGF